MYDLTPFIDGGSHPGGNGPILEVCGQDATEAFNDAGHNEDAFDELRAYEIGKSVPTSNTSDCSWVDDELSHSLSLHPELNISWSVIGTDLVEFEVVTTAKWAAVGFSGTDSVHDEGEAVLAW